MWLLVIVLVVLLFMRRTSYASDEVTVQSIVKTITDKFPTMTPVSTISIDGTDSRMVFFDTKDYSGKVVDMNQKGIVPRSPADASIAPYVDGAYKSYDEILDFRV